MTSVQLTKIASERHRARAFGVFFICTFLAYGIGSALADQLVTAPDLLTLLAQQGNQLVLAIVLMAVLHSFFNIALMTSIKPVLAQHAKWLMDTYAGLAIVSTTMLAIGATLLLVVLPLGEVSDTTLHQTLALMLAKANFYTYQVGMAIWGIGGLLLCIALLRSQMVPAYLSAFGLLGYLLFTAGCLMELFGLPYGIMLSLPGAVFEIGLSGYLIGKGFRQR